jgi:ubiquinol-cytochrome c reductase cytochrome b subunit
VLFALLVAVPFVDRGRERYWRRRPVALAAAVVVLLTMAGLTIVTTLTTAVEHLG